MRKIDIIQLIAEHIEDYDGPANDCAEMLLDKLVASGMLPPEHIITFPDGFKRRIFDWEHDELDKDVSQ